MSGHPWLPPAMSGHPWFLPAMSRHSWLLPAMSGHPWLPSDFLLGHALRLAYMGGHEDHVHYRFSLVETLSI